jgi:hypothetical protein
MLDDRKESPSAPTIPDSSTDDKKTIGNSTSDPDDRQFADAVKALHMPINSRKDSNAHGATDVPQYPFSVNSSTLIKPKTRHVGFRPVTASRVLITAEGNTIAIGAQGIGTGSASANVNNPGPTPSEPVDFHAPLPDNQWYAVIVGFEVGVFSSW